MFLCGIDVGGTFTDVLGWDEDSGELRSAKVPTTDDQAEGFLAGVRIVTGDDLSALRHVVHGTTVATNALLERRGSVVGMITTRGFRDLLELRRRDRPLPYGLRADYRPLVERRFRAEVDERVDCDGLVERAVDAEEVVEVAGRLLDGGAESLAVTFLNSFANPTNEVAAREALAEAYPDAFVTASTDLLPELGEFERTVAAALNSYVGPGLRGYLTRLDGSMKSSGFAGTFQVIQSNGGGMGIGVTGRYAAQTFLSGPAAGVKATETLAEDLEMPNVISADMGGTSFDVAVIVNGRASTSAENTIEYGLPLKLSAIDISTIGAGGGSIAHIDRGGVLQVGPQSAGANPGPAAYARGGKDATITDANVVLGRLSGAALGTERSVTIDPDAAGEAVRHLAERMQALVTDAAWAIVELADEKMGSAIRRVSVERGLDPSEFSLVAYGGAGPLHAASLARRVGVDTVIVPPFPGLHSALGCLLAPVRHDFSRGVHRKLEAETLDEVHAIFEEQEVEARALLAEEGYGQEDPAFVYSLDVAYKNQLNHINVPIRRHASVEDVAANFDGLYRQLYSNPLAGGTPVVVNARLTSETRPAGPTPERLTEGIEEARRGKPAGHRGVLFERGSPHETPVYEGRSRAPESFAGPAVIEESSTTILVPPGWSASIRDTGTLIMIPNV